MISLLLVESFDLRPSNQCILVRVIPSCFRLVKMCLRQVSQGAVRDTWFLFLGELHTVSLRVVNVTWIALDVSFYSPFLNQFWIAARLVCSLCGAMVGSLSVASTAVSSTMVAVVDSCEVGRSAMCSMYNNGRRTLQWGTPALTGEDSKTR
jgi:hypothetical protein